jgi:hypothetical protein
MQRRRIQLFILMATSFISVLVMFFIDGYMHVYFSQKFTSGIEIALTVSGRMIQYFAVISLIYYYLYWPLHRNLLEKDKLDVVPVSTSFENPAASDNRQS